MATLQPALQQTLRFEGGYANISGDTGGETYCGISRPNWPTIGIWAIIDASNPPLKNGTFLQGASADTANSMISEFYRIQFWEGIRGNDINSQSVAAYLFDWHVTSGNIPIQQVQEILGVEVDGCVGVQTLAAINSANSQTLWNQMVAVRVQRARDRVAHDAGQAKFLKGWLNRFQGFKF
ncbi:MAG: glycosyl hydrolase 108 family protein [Chitinophagaceae bacterium]